MSGHAKSPRWHEPKVGETVRIVEVSEKDWKPAHKAGDVFVVGEALTLPQTYGAGVYELHEHGVPGTTWARVELAEPPTATIGGVKFTGFTEVSYSDFALDAALDLDRFAEVCRAWVAIGPNARAALVELARRMAVGRERYGEDFDIGRDWAKEASEEFLDGAIYLAVKAVKEAKGAT